MGDRWLPGRARYGRRDVLRLGLAGAVALGSGGAVAACSRPAAAPATGSPRRGGTLRVGINGGSAKDTLDAHKPTVSTDTARLIQLYDTLAGYDRNARVEMALAETIEPSADARTWTVRLRDGLEFHNGKAITAADVAYTFRRITDSRVGAFGALQFATLDRAGIEVLDRRTVRLPFTGPKATLLDAVAQYYNGIVPEGYDPRQPVGSGPFRLEAFKPGEQSTFRRHEHYWRSGEPYLDRLVIIDFPDDTSRVNALLGGQVHAVNQLPLGQITAVRNTPGLRVVEAETGSWVPFTMRADRPPFADARIRQAMRLLVDRKQMVQQVLGGHGALGNDMYGRFDPCYPTGTPQREQDLDQARSLLRAAGAADLTVELVTSEAVAAGATQAAQVFAAQAAAGGVTVRVRKVDASVLYGENYLKWPFSQDFWVTRPYLLQAALSQASDALYNATHWNDPEWTDLIHTANRTVDGAARCGLIQQAQRIEHERGTLIIWGFPNQIDGHSSTVGGVIADRGGLPLGGYRFRSAWLSA
jgi:peptide/nickel transport system substrate-binding protein